MPGADIGVLACALIVAKWFAKRFDRTIAADDLREVVFGVVGGMPNFSYHTDRPSLTTGSDRYQGCSYCRLLATQSASFRPYDLDGNQLAALQQTLEGLEGMYVKPDVLRGGHDEVAVLFIRNVHDLRNCEPLSFDEIRRAPKFWVLDNYAVLRGTGRRRAFVYQRDLAETRLARLASGLAKSLGLSASRTAELRKIVGDVGTLHVHRALQHLARGLPFYNILIDVRSGEIGEPERFA
jgi:hypothetical protein